MHCTRGACLETSKASFAKSLLRQKTSPNNLGGVTMTVVTKLKLTSNPFEHYTAETEPHISAYAVRPPYHRTISDRAANLSSFIMFGHRGAGKSATRITVFAEAWKNVADEASRKPFVVNLTDFSAVNDVFKSNKISDRDLVAIAAFCVVEQILVWLSSLEVSEREHRIDALSQSDRTLTLALIKGFYLNVPDLDREVSTTDALKLLNTAWYTKSSVWVGKRWDSLSAIIAAAIDALSKRQLENAVDISAPAEALLKSLKGESANTSRAILSRLVDFVKAFGFSGVCVLVDKVDETPMTSSSAEATARLIYPLLTHIQLLEVDGFAWILFLWGNVQDHFNDTKLAVRLDKIPNANITWDKKSLREMIEARVSYFSEGRHNFAGLFERGVSVDDVFENVATLAGSSPRELIKLLDIIVREHDARPDTDNILIDQTSIDLGQDKYAKETIGTWFKEKPLQQVLRLGKPAFVNRDVQTIFKITDQGARVRINNWEDAGLVRQNGTAPSEVGGKPVYRYVVADARVERIITRNLDAAVGAGAEDGMSDEIEN